MNPSPRRWITILIPPLVLLLLTVVIWQLAVTLLEIKPYLLPSPGAVVEAAIKHRGELGSAIWLTGRAAGLGLLVSILLGTATALVFSQSRVVRRSFYPYAIALQTVPIVAIAPLIVTWFGEGFQSIVLVTVIISLFPVITSVTTGLTSIDEGLHDLFQLNQASRWQQLVKLRIPSAIPSLVTGARTAAGLAVVGAIVGEFFAGASVQERGLGYFVLYAVPNLQTDLLFGCVIAATLLGVAMFVAVSLVGTHLLGRWTAEMETH
jgi:NitT/TauT family transport system permease protein